MKASNVLAPKKTSREMPDLEEAIEEEDMAVDDDNGEEEDDIKTDKLIKQPKAKGGAKKATKKTKKANGDDSDNPKPAKGQGRGRPAGKGRGGKK
jgi:replication factor C subunit 1